MESRRRRKPERNTDDVRTGCAPAVLFASTLRSLPIEIAPPPPVASIMTVAMTHGLSAYDAAYLELAERTGLPLAALDGRLRAAAVAGGVQVLPN